MKWSASLLLVVLLAGCTTWGVSLRWNSDPELEAKARQVLSTRPARLTQRAVVKVRGREFSCDGVVQFQADGGLRLAVLSPMGVMAELRMDKEGAIEVVKTTPSFRNAWAQEYIGTVVKLLFPIKVAEMRAYGSTTLLREQKDGTRWLYSFEGGKWRSATLERDGLRVWVAKGSTKLWHIRGRGVEMELRTVECR